MAAHAVVARGRVGPGGRKSRGRVAPGEVASPKGRGPVGLARRLPGVRVALASCRPWLRVSTASRHRCSQSPQSYSQSEHEKREWEHGWRRVGTVERRVGCDYALFARVAWVLPLSHVQVSERSAVAGGGGGMPWSVFDFFAPHKSSPPPRPVQRPRTPAVQSRAPALPPDSGWLSGPVVLRLQEGAAHDLTLTRPQPASS